LQRELQWFLGLGDSFNTDDKVWIWMGSSWQPGTMVAPGVRHGMWVASVVCQGKKRVAYSNKQDIVEVPTVFIEHRVFTLETRRPPSLRRSKVGLLFVLDLLWVRWCVKNLVRFSYSIVHRRARATKKTSRTKGSQVQRNFFREVLHRPTRSSNSAWNLTQLNFSFQKALARKKEVGGGRDYEIVKAWFIQWQLSL
jgi:hypothetical protein